MTMNLGRELAKIYQFPVKPRITAPARSAKIKSPSQHKSIPFEEVTFGGGWYHEAAIREAERNQTI